MSHDVSPRSQLDFNVYFQPLMDQYLGRNGLSKKNQNFKKVDYAPKTGIL